MVAEPAPAGDPEILSIRMETLQEMATEMATEMVTCV
jgi:hypothetical protein